MKPFFDDDFLLETKTAIELYDEFAKGQPIIDYHCHLPPDQIADNHRFKSSDGDLARTATTTSGAPCAPTAWPSATHRRCVGLGEVRGVGPDRAAHAAQSALPLDPPRAAFPFGVDASSWARHRARDLRPCNALLAQRRFHHPGLLRKYDVRVVCTTDDPADDLEPHAGTPATRRRSPSCYRPGARTRPSRCTIWRLERLGRPAGGGGQRSIGDLPRSGGPQKRHDFFHESGCRSSDHGLDPCAAAVHRRARSRPSSPRRGRRRWLRTRSRSSARRCCTTSP